MFQPIAVERVLNNIPPLKEAYNSIYELTAKKLEGIEFEDLNYK